MQVLLITALNEIALYIAGSLRRRYKETFTFTAGREYRWLFITRRCAVESHKFCFGYHHS